MTTSKVLATDLDGTFIPLSGHAENVFALLRIERALRAGGFQLVFVTGRHFELTLEAIRSHGLPTPDVLIADVGTSIYLRGDHGWQLSDDYAATLSKIVSAESLSSLGRELAERDGLTLQEQEKQGPSKLSFYTCRHELPKLANEIRVRLATTGYACDVIDSVDPFNGDGLIDIVPRGASKAFAIDWWRQSHGWRQEEIVFAGDSGNDLAALTAGYRAIVVGNASEEVREEVTRSHRQAGWTDRLFAPTDVATSGVLAGATHFGLIQDAVTLGASVVKESASFAVWAPDRDHVDVVLDADGSKLSQRLTKRAGVHAGQVSIETAKLLYGFRVEGGPVRPDPRSRFQPNGVHGLSALLPHTSFAWTDQDWPGVPREELVIYELHLGTLTETGSFRSAIAVLDELVDLGVTAIELMPVAACPGRWNWGYDGVCQFAPSVNYGTSDDFRALVDAAHQRGLAVILDVVYNHLGPEGNYLAEFGPYFNVRHQTPWGDGLNFDSYAADGVRDFFVDNALYWLDEFHLDGLRLDAVHAIIDDTERHILTDIRRAVTRYASVVSREIHLIAETNLYDPIRLAESEESAPYDLIWCDDLMHAIYSHLTSDAKHTVRSYHGFQDVAECLERGYLYRGLPERRADEEELPVAREPLVIALQNHDVVGNDPHGRRFHHLTSIETQRAVAPLFLLQPSTPLLFMGEESASASPFHFFVDFSDEHVRLGVEQGRAREYPAIADAEAVSPTSLQAFEQSRLVHSNPAMRDWYRSLLAIRRQLLRKGLLTTEHLQIESISELSIVKLLYSDRAGQNYFVLVRMEKDTDSAAVGIDVDGSILADSEAPTTGRSLQLAAVHAIIGEGQVSLPRLER